MGFETGPDTLSVCRGLLALGFLLAVLLRRMFRRPLASLSQVDHMEGPEFEQWCASLLRCNGFHHVSVVGRANDQGTDIIAFRGWKKYAIQCKRYSRKVNNEAVQEINAGVEYYSAQVAVVMTNNYFTRGAVDAAERCDVMLWDRTKLIRMMQTARRW